MDKIFYKFLWRSKDKVKRNKITQSVEHGGLNMIDTRLFFDSLLAIWINRIQEADPNLNSWVQLSRLFLKSFDFNGVDVDFNFDVSVVFPAVEQLPRLYKKMVKCYNKAYVTDQFTFVNNIMNQSLWGNKYITSHRGCKKNVLFLRNWIRSGIRKVGDLRFRNGTIDEYHVYQNLEWKQNMYTEVKLVKEALRPYKQSLKDGNTLPTNIVRFKKSRDFYNEFKHQLSVSNPIRANLVSYCTEEDESYIFTTKVKREQEIKLKEFNFKLLHGILPCNRNLQKWKIRLDDKCDVCGLSQTIEHLLYSCSYVKPLWRIVELFLGVNIRFDQIVGVDKHFVPNAVITIVCFLIYKEWLLLSLEDKHRSTNIELSYYKSELLMRTEIYKLCKCIDKKHIDHLEELIQLL